MLQSKTAKVIYKAYQKILDKPGIFEKSLEYSRQLSHSIFTLIYYKIL